MVPVLDMVNHSSQPNAYFEHTSSNGVSLLMRPNMVLEVDSEITISYGTSKSEAEMLFSYGFIDEQSTNKSLALTLEPFPDDPLGKAKKAVFAGPPLLRIYVDQDEIKWECPFLFLMLLNEEDGLEFRMLQQTDGSRSQLKVFWQGSDKVTPRKLSNLSSAAILSAMSSNFELSPCFRIEYADSLSVFMRAKTKWT